MPGGANTNISGLPFEDQVKDLVFNQEMDKRRRLHDW